MARMSMKTRLDSFKRGLTRNRGLDEQVAQEVASTMEWALRPNGTVRVVWDGLRRGDVVEPARRPRKARLDGYRIAPSWSLGRGAGRGILLGLWRDGPDSVVVGCSAKKLDDACAWVERGMGSFSARAALFGPDDDSFGDYLASGAWRQEDPGSRPQFLPERVPELRALVMRANPLSPLWTDLSPEFSLDADYSRQVERMVQIIREHDRGLPTDDPRRLDHYLGRVVASRAALGDPYPLGEEVLAAVSA